MPKIIQVADLPLQSHNLTIRGIDDNYHRGGKKVNFTHHLLKSQFISEILSTFYRDSQPPNTGFVVTGFQDGLDGLLLLLRINFKSKTSHTFKAKTSGLHLMETFLLKDFFEDERGKVRTGTNYPAPPYCKRR